MPSALLRQRLDRELPWSRLGAFPTPVEPLGELERGASRGTLFVKREDFTSPIYGGNKVRALEPLLGEARASGARVVYASGACGAHSVLATALHAARLGFEPRALVFPQPFSARASENLRHVLARCSRVVAVSHWALLPVATVREALHCRRAHETSAFLPPACASPLGVLGHVSAALELVEQVERGELPVPELVVVGLGSGCTAAGLVLGFRLAERWGVRGWRAPRVVAVRVAPWPLASKARVVDLSLGAARLLSSFTRERCPMPGALELTSTLVVDGSQLGPGYGHATRAGQAATERFRAVPQISLEPTYSAKIAAGFLDWSERRPERVSVFWTTSSSARLGEPGEPRAPVPARLVRWLSHAPAEAQSSFDAEASPRSSP